MSLWTPDGERPVSPADPAATPAANPASNPAANSASNPASSNPVSAADQPAAPELTQEQEEQARAVAKELADARARLLETEVSTVLTNHALGIYELAAIHLTAEQPDLAEAQLAIDGLAALVEGLAGRLGEGEPTLRDALHQARMAFVQRRDSTATAGGTGTGTGETAGEAAG